VIIFFFGVFETEAPPRFLFPSLAPVLCRFPSLSCLPPLSLEHVVLLRFQGLLYVEVPTAPPDEAWVFLLLLLQKSVSDL